MHFAVECCEFKTVHAFCRRTESDRESSHVFWIIPPESRTGQVCSGTGLKLRRGQNTKMAAKQVQMEQGEKEADSLFSRERLSSDSPVMWPDQSSRKFHS